MQVVNCTTPANYFHALRRQMHRDFRKPLIIMTPKSLLRNKYCVSNLEDFSKDNSFHRIMWDHAIDKKSKGFIKLKKSKEIKKVIMCSGKVYFDLLEAREKLKKDDVILFRIEQLYPFPAKSLTKELKPYAKNAKFYWCQEEPKNMGAWFSVRDYIQWTLDTIKANNNKISYIGRSPDASPATGYAKRHIFQQQEIIKEVFK
jgi:2-oxoglutarate dehydrogenase E1 component